MVGFTDRKESIMDCKHCGYYWADLDDEGKPISLPYCHYEGPDEWAPCAQDDYEELDDDEDDYNEEAEMAAYEQWLHDEGQRELDEGWPDEYGAPYDYKEF